MPRIVPGRKYTRAQLQALVDQSTADELALQGYALRHDVLDDTYTVVHWTNAGGTIGTEDGRQNRKARMAVEPVAFDEKDLPPIVRRTAQQRVDSLMIRLLEAAKTEGRAFLPDSVIREVVGEAWKDGRVEITAEVVRQVAAHFLQRADRVAGRASRDRLPQVGVHGVLPSDSRTAHQA